MFYLLDKVKAELAYPSASAGITGWYRRMQFVRIEDITSEFRLLLLVHVSCRERN